MYSVLRTNKTPRQIHISNHQKPNYLKCGLINIKNEDDACFKHCTSYHQTQHENHDGRLTNLEKYNNTYTYNNISYPTSLEDVKLF